jgi:glycosyltransferase involved in cell wall biosynthesis
MWVGRLAPQKAPDRFARLFTSLAAETPRVRGVMIGSGPLETYLRRLVRDLGVSERLRLVEDQHAVRIMPAADICVMTSRYEGLPYVLLEAQAVGLPIVAFHVGGLTTAIEHGESGFAVRQDDESSFLEALRRLIADGNLRTAMGRAGVRRAQRFRLDVMVDRIEALYQGLSGGGRYSATAAA